MRINEQVVGFAFQVVESSRSREREGLFFGRDDVEYVKCSDEHGVIADPDGVLMWDSTSVIEHLDVATDADRSVLPGDPTLRFLAHLLDDFSDEWFYRPAVGSRWSYPANTEPAGWQIAEELSALLGFPGATTRANVVATMTASLPKLGVVPGTIDAWMEEVVVPWFQALDAHLGEGYLLGDRPSIADFAIFGANVAHFVGDVYCRELADEHGPAAVAHTHRLQMPISEYSRAATR